MNEQNETRNIKAEDINAWEKWYELAGCPAGGGTSDVWEECCKYKEIELAALRVKFNDAEKEIAELRHSIINLVKNWSIASELRELSKQEKT